MAVPRIAYPVLPFIELRADLRRVQRDVDALHDRVRFLAEQSRQLVDHVRDVRERTRKHLESVNSFWANADIQRRRWNK